MKPESIPSIAHCLWLDIYIYGMSSRKMQSELEGNLRLTEIPFVPISILMDSRKHFFNEM